LTTKVLVSCNFDHFAIVHWFLVIVIVIVTMPNRSLPRRRCKKSAKLSASANKVNKCILQSAFEELIQTKKRKGKLEYGDVTALVQCYHELGHTFIKRRQLTYLLAKHACRVDVDEIVGVSVGETLVNGLVNQDTSSLTDEETNARNMGGRPKDVAFRKESEQERIRLALTAAAEKYDIELKEAAKRNGKTKMVH
jgi:hypothetical protein